MTKQFANAEAQLMEAVVKCEAYKVEKLIYSEADVNATHGQVMQDTEIPAKLYSTLPSPLKNH